MCPPILILSDTFSPDFITTGVTTHEAQKAAAKKYRTALHLLPLADGERIACRKRGVVNGTDHCRSFRYDPLRRTPPKPAVLRGHFTDADFSLGDTDEEQ